jgi:hypothetical protein
MRLLGRIPAGTNAPRRRNRWELLLRSLGAAAVLAVGMLGLGASPIGGVVNVRAASPSPSADVGGDTRSSGEGPGLVGAPGLAILAVVGLGVLTVLATTLYVRLSGGRRPSD